MENLELAWRRITTGDNANYKNLFRDIYYAYEVALIPNLTDLSQRLVGGSYVASKPERIYSPKASGLHRPISLLHIEDQIVLQAFANLAAIQTEKRRQPVQSSSVFSNIFQKQKSIFFVERWQVSFARFQDKTEQLY